MNLPSPQAFAFDGGLTAWVIYLITRGVPALITIATLVLVILRVMIALREWRRG